jgi:hypothetical protein
MRVGLHRYTWTTLRNAVDLRCLPNGVTATPRERDDGTAIDSVGSNAVRTEVLAE